MTKSAASRSLRMRSPSCPHPARPFFHMPACCSAYAAGSQLLPARVVLVDPGKEVVGRQVGEGEKQVCQVALWIDDHRGDPVERRLLQEADAQARLAAAGHAHAHGMGHEVLRVIQQERFVSRCRRASFASEVEHTELLEILHGMTSRGSSSVATLRRARRALCSCGRCISDGPDCPESSARRPHSPRRAPGGPALDASRAGPCYLYAHSMARESPR